MFLFVLIYKQRIQYDSTFKHAYKPSNMYWDNKFEEARKVSREICVVFHRTLRDKVGISRIMWGILILLQSGNTQETSEWLL